MTRPVRLVSAGVAAEPDTRQPFGDRTNVAWQTTQGHGPGHAAAQVRPVGMHKSGVVVLAEPVRRDLGFSSPRSVRLVSVPDPRAANGGPRGIGDELQDLKTAVATLLARVERLEAATGHVAAPEVVKPAVAPSEPALSPQQRIDRDMAANLAALNRGAIKQFRR